MAEEVSYESDVKVQTTVETYYIDENGNRTEGNILSDYGLISRETPRQHQVFNYKTTLNGNLILEETQHVYFWYDGTKAWNFHSYTDIKKYVSCNVSVYQDITSSIGEAVVDAKGNKVQGFASTDIKDL